MTLKLRADHAFDFRRPPAENTTFEEFMEWLDDDVHAEWVDGEVEMMGPVSEDHQDIGGFLISLIREFVSLRKLGIVLYDPFQMRLKDSRSSRAPDLMFVANANRSRLKKNYLDGPADLAVEIVSPDSAKRDRVQKRAEYEREGVAEYWIIDPEKERAEFYALNSAGRYEAMPLDGDGWIHSRVLPGLRLKVEDLWLDPLPSAYAILRKIGVL